LYTNFANNNVSIFSDNDTKQTFKNTYNMGLKVRLGYTVSQQAMIFLGLGMEKSKWQAKDVAQRAAHRGGQTFKKNKSNFAFAPSVGMDMFVNKNLFIRGEFTYVLAPKMTITGDTASTPFVGTGTTAKIAATQQRFTLGLGYKF
jgi:opacity protein-like surface antigen